MLLDFPGSSAGKEIACNVGNPSSTSRLGRPPGELIGYPLHYSWASLVAQMIKNLPADPGSLPVSGRSPGGGHGNPLQYSCLENSMGRGAWWSPIHRITKSWTRLKQLSTAQQSVLLRNTYSLSCHFIPVNK